MKNICLHTISTIRSRITSCLPQTAIPLTAALMLSLFPALKTHGHTAPGEPVSPYGKMMKTIRVPHHIQSGNSFICLFDSDGIESTIEKYILVSSDDDGKTVWETDLNPGFVIRKTYYFDGAETLKTSYWTAGKRILSQNDGDGNQKNTVVVGCRAISPELYTFITESLYHVLPVQVKEVRMSEKHTEEIEQSVNSVMGPFVH